VSGTSTSGRTARKATYQRPTAAPTAMMIAELIPGGPAERDGLMRGDVLLKLGGEPVSGVDDLHCWLIADLAGTEQSVEILRAGRLVTRTVKPELDA
jgi:S1-C subfamily serine protease